MEKKKLSFVTMWYTLPVSRLFYIAILTMVMIAAILLALINYTSKYTVQIPARGGQYNVISTNNIRYLDPIFASNDSEVSMSKLIYSGILRKVDNKYVNDIAKNVEMSPDGLSINIELKKAKFSDGTDLKSTDIAYTIELIQDSLINSPRHKEWRSISVNIIDDTHINLKLKSQIEDIQQVLTQGIIKKSEWLLLPKASLSLSNLNLNAIGAGPYKLKSTEEANKIITKLSFVINDYYQSINSLPYIEYVNWKVVSNTNQIHETIKAGEIYTAMGLDPSELNAISNSNPNIRIAKSKMYRSFGLFFNPSIDKNLASISYRTDLRNSIDTNGIINKVLGGYATPASHLYNQYYDNSRVSSNVISEDYKDKSITISTVNNSDLIKVANLIKDDWTKLGLKVDIETYDIGEFHQDVIKNRNYSVLLFAIDTHNDEDIYNLWHSSGRVYPGTNISNYYSSTLDKNLETLISLPYTYNNKITDDKKVLYNNIDDELYSNVAWVPLYSPYMVFTLDKSIYINIDNNIYNTSQFIDNIVNAYIKTETVYNMFSTDTFYKKLSDFTH